jgi:hypothetical protein
MTHFMSYRIEKEWSPGCRLRLVFTVLDEPEPNVTIRLFNNGSDVTHALDISGTNGRNRHTLEQGRKIWNRHVVAGYRRVKG